MGFTVREEQDKIWSEQGGAWYKLHQPIDLVFLLLQEKLGQDLIEQGGAVPSFKS